MAYRRIKLAPHEQYHLYNRGNNKQDIFHSTSDYIRFLFYLLYFQSPVAFPAISFQVSAFKRTGEFTVSEEARNDVIARRSVALNAFCLMPNHFHIMVEETTDGGISKYMQRVLNGYSKYGNKKYPEKHIGHIFQGPFKHVRQRTNEQFLYLSTYIHRNPKELKPWTMREKEYPWSSFQDFIGDNRWGGLLRRDSILTQFNGGRDYERFVDTSVAKKEYNTFLHDDDILLESRAGEGWDRGEII